MLNPDVETVACVRNSKETTVAEVIWERERLVRHEVGNVLYFYGEKEASLLHRY